MEWFVTDIILYIEKKSDLERGLTPSSQNHMDFVFFGDPLDDHGPLLSQKSSFLIIFALFTL